MNPDILRAKLRALKFELHDLGQFQLAQLIDRWLELCDSTLLDMPQKPDVITCEACGMGIYDDARSYCADCYDDACKEN